jgi:hypothetical protein
VTVEWLDRLLDRLDRLVDEEPMFGVIVGLTISVAIGGFVIAIVVMGIAALSGWSPRWWWPLAGAVIAPAGMWLLFAIAAGVTWLRHR